MQSEILPPPPGDNKKWRLIAQPLTEYTLYQQIGEDPLVLQRFREGAAMVLALTQGDTLDQAVRKAGSTPITYRQALRTVQDTYGTPTLSGTYQQLVQNGVIDVRPRGASRKPHNLHVVFRAPQAVADAPPQLTEAQQQALDRVVHRQRSRNEAARILRKAYAAGTTSEAVAKALVLNTPEGNPAPPMAYNGAPKRTKLLAGLALGYDREALYRQLFVTANTVKKQLRFARNTMRAQGGDFDLIWYAFRSGLFLAGKPYSPGYTGHLHPLVGSLQNAATSFES